MSTPPVGVPTCYRHSDRETWIRCQRCERPICPDCMREASVGFQCPECVAEGRRSVRQARTAYGGQITGNPGAVSIALIGINVVVWIAIMASGRYGSKLYDLFALAVRGSCREDNGTYYPFVDKASCHAGTTAHWADGVSDGAFWQLLTSMFTHVEPWHLGFNMLALWVLGPQLESILGRGRYLALYLLSGLAGSVAVYWLAGEQTTTVGASGAVFGLMGALVVVGLKLGANIQSLLMWIGINVVLTFTLSNVSWQGHFGGLAGGAAIAAVLVYAPKERRTAVQAAGLSAIGAVLVVATLARTLALS
ncbi:MULTISPECIES: rhomboid family intramembrane serine protease [unclassified Nocardioides]|uniref:rhomboid family intramembrane serine protease n=1 Tax=unclassified Nocardioides TaxID=2615069 RepID=UPI0011529878|nr:MULTISPECIES: rhomboid family intramembrane serine protease [unclassified Nocardioides]TQK68506.1 membrane associated rhomboid family serine protease [Nocardioides sp. SLBN-35]WGY02195.1 rhomboid family intramembrane serine protease [Nocardioides sp. QY071]